MKPTRRERRRDGPSWTSMAAAAKALHLPRWAAARRSGEWEGIWHVVSAVTISYSGRERLYLREGMTLEHARKVARALWLSRPT